MEDQEIIGLFFQRSQQAVEEVEKQYGSKLRHLAQRLLGDARDAEECVSDACLGAWDSIPPNRPQALFPYLCKLVRNQCLKRRRANNAQKRGGGGLDAAFEELEECLASPQSPEADLDAKELTQLLNEFVEGLSKKDRILFLGRYWFGEPYRTLAPRLRMTQGHAAVRLSRIREKLRNYLIEKEAL